MAKKGIKSNKIGGTKKERVLTLVEKTFIEVKSGDMAPELIAEHLPGVTVEMITKHISSLKQDEPPHDDINDMLEGITDPDERRRMQLAYSGELPGNRMARDKSKGVAIMTAEAAEIADARKVHQVAEVTDDQKKRRRKYIHEPFKE